MESENERSTGSVTEFTVHNTNKRSSSYFETDAIENARPDDRNIQLVAITEHLAYIGRICNTGKIAVVKCLDYAENLF